MRSTKHFKKLTRLMLLVGLMTYLGGASSCSTGVKFDPQFHKATSFEQAIVSEQGVRIKCDQPAFDDFMCITRAKMKELAEILKKARMPKDEKKQALKILSEALK